MPTSRDLLKNLNEQTIDQVRRTQDAVVDAVRSVNNHAPRVAGLSQAPADTERLVDSAFGFARSVLDLNHRFAHRLLELAGVEGRAGTAVVPVEQAPAEPVEQAPEEPVVTAKRAPAKKTTAKKTTAKKTTAKKTTAKKTTAKKSPAKKSPAKKATAKKTTAKKSPDAG